MPEFLGFLRALEGESCGPWAVKVIAGAVKVVADHAGEIRDLRRVRVYYAALATREMWHGQPHAVHGVRLRPAPRT
ncbi:hypothetical protein GCM10023194_10360 [Planotetraspora phitsanulokensis]|uniref:Uncharacterized protein n=1 Tax=Planotetraspora phitsanulokensis TaxID=575192 RepID=A0A8J3XGY7_9ACTN|nr:hypothetical protein [Planotetraspora phitsanulokensis]GII40639.1 hypothetical protein Pph01_56420 [Planotetraspora phitsanulokensis]